MQSSEWLRTGDPEIAGRPSGRPRPGSSGTVSARVSLYGLRLRAGRFVVTRGRRNWPPFPVITTLHRRAEVRPSSALPRARAGRHCLPQMEMFEAYGFSEECAGKEACWINETDTSGARRPRRRE